MISKPRKRRSLSVADDHFRLLSEVYGEDWLKLLVIRVVDIFIYSSLACLHNTLLPKSESSIRQYCTPQQAVRMYMSDHEYEEQRNTLLVRFEGHFQSSQTPSDASAEIISIIKSYPTPACAEALAFSTVLHAHASPQGVDGLVLAIKTIKDALEAYPIEILQDDGPQLFTFVFGYTLSDFMNDYLHETYLHQPKRTTITPTNATLSTALFSASGLKHRMFLGNSGVYGFARQGLQLPNADREPERDEVLAVGACLQLSVAGAKDWLDDGDGNTVLQALKGLKERRVVRSSDGMRLLDKTISIAEGKFSQVISPEQAWNILFST